MEHPISRTREKLHKALAIAATLIQDGYDETLDETNIPNIAKTPTSPQNMSQFPPIPKLTHNHRHIY